MALAFNMDAMNWLADHRSPALTVFMQAASALGDVPGYILIGALIYVAFDKRLAVRLMLLVALTMCLNHVLKLAIKNPRPFLQGGDYLNKWAVSPDSARDLAAEYSTPSGHAMASASFYAYLYGVARDRRVRTVALLAILLIGFSRPYLGVHFVEDILLGWAIGLGAALVALRYGEAVGTWWDRQTYARGIAMAVAASLALWAAAIAINGGQIDSQPHALLAYAGTITGIVIARPLELGVVDFDPGSGSARLKIQRFALTIALTSLTLVALGRLNLLLTDKASLAGYALQYIRYIAVTVVGLFVAPWLFTRLGWAEKASLKPTPNGSGARRPPPRREVKTG